MGVYIKGMEMPKSCFYCQFRLKINPDDIKCFALQREFEETFGGTIERRLPNCPLVEVKAPHGDLIDRDAILSFINAGHLSNPATKSWSDTEVVDMLESRPTALEAED